MGYSEIGFAVGALILLIAFIYGVMQYRRRNPANEPITDDATRASYENPDRYHAKTETELRNKTKPS